MKRTDRADAPRQQSSATTSVGVSAPVRVAPMRRRASAGMAWPAIIGACPAARPERGH
jgi:hypothetical protein